MLTVLVGAQFGSEGKGLTVGHIAGGYQVHVRVGAANAGHTVYVNGEKHVVQQLPVAAYANPYASLVLGAGAMLSPHILSEEIETNTRWREANRHPDLRLKIDGAAHVIQPAHIEREQASGLATRIGSTSAIAKEGIGAAQAARVMRSGYQTFMEARAEGFLDNNFVELTDTVTELGYARAMGTSILLEGTQGMGLDNVLGFYPYVTSRHVTASGLLADCGFGPRDVDTVIIVARTYPIRVAGPSGPFWPDSKEIDWSDIGVDGWSERTTVTKKVRRVATFSYHQIASAARINSATEIALNFADYLAPEIKGEHGLYEHKELDSYDYLGPMIRRIEERTQVPVTMVGTGPETVIDRSPPVL